MTWNRSDPQGNEAGKIRWELVPYTRGMGLDLGCGPYKAFPHFIGVDNLEDVRLFSIPMKPDFVLPTCEKLTMFASQSMNFVFSSHLLEHIEDYQATLKEWWRVIKVGGHLCLYLPHKSFYPNIGQPGSNPDHKHDFMPEAIIEAMKALGGWDLVENQDRNEGTEYSFFQVYKKTNGKKQDYSYLAPKPAKTCGIVRYGAFGDILMASSVLPALKAEGYHITLYTVPRAHEVIKHDPNIDRFIIQDTDQVPNHELSAFWDYEAKKYDKFINLSESVEASFLALPDRIAARWPKEVRHELMDKNYLEFQHKLAGVPMTPKQKFYATEEEKQWARKQRAQMDAETLVLWSLSGSSVHKVWPHLDTILARFMLTYPKCKVVLVGDEACKILEQGWENEPRVVKKSGKWTIRETLSFISVCDLVVGPETGILNAAAFEPMPKIVTLSHSSIENLTRDWVNTKSLTPTDTHCYPCHLLHYSFANCHKGPETGVALCQENISADAMWDAIREILGLWVAL